MINEDLTEAKLDDISRNTDKLDQTDLDIVEEFRELPESERVGERLEEIEDIWWRVT